MVFKIFGLVKHLFHKVVEYYNFFIKCKNTLSLRMNTQLSETKGASVTK